MFSDDAGENWSTPTRVNDNIRPTDHARTMLAVSRDGILGVAWYDRRNGDAEDCYDIYLSSAADGGESFAPNVRLSTTTSCQNTAGNVITDPNGQRDIAERWSYGGDYSAIAAGGDGRFHVVWADSRTGVYQLWTRRSSSGSDDASRWAVFKGRASRQQPVAGSASDSGSLAFR